MHVASRHLRTLTSSLQIPFSHLHRGFCAATDKPLVRLSDVFVQDEAVCSGLHIDDFHLSAGDRWVVLTSGGSAAKSLLKRLVLGEASPLRGEVKLGVKAKQIEQISHEAQQALVDAEIAKGDLNKNPAGRRVAALVENAAGSVEVAAEVMDICKISHLQEQGFRTLSSGETRRLMIAMVLARAAELYLLDDPFAGLDAENQAWMRTLLGSHSNAFRTSLTFITHTDQVPDAASHVALLEEDRLSPSMTSSEWEAHPIHAQLQNLSKKAAEDIVAALERSGESAHGRDGVLEDSSNVLFRIQQGTVKYTERTIFDKLEWTIRDKEQWQVRGPNGCGKSSTLNLIFGDHPQCYSNNIQVLGFQRGSGESIWEVKRQMSMVSSQLHLQHRTNTKALHVVASGLFDSIGLFDTPTKKEWKEALLWLQLFQMDHLKNVGFRQLSYGQQRMLLIARALIKRPKLLLLDEPCQGLDLLSRATVLKAMELIASYKLCTMVYVTHHKEDTVPGFTHVLDFVRDDCLSDTFSCKASRLS